MENVISMSPNRFTEKTAALQFQSMTLQPFKFQEIQTLFSDAEIFLFMFDRVSIFPVFH